MRKTAAIRRALIWAAMVPALAACGGKTRLFENGLPLPLTQDTVFAAGLEELPPRPRRALEGLLGRALSSISAQLPPEETAQAICSDGAQVRLRCSPDGWERAKNYAEVTAALLRGEDLLDFPEKTLRGALLSCTPSAGWELELFLPAHQSFLKRAEKMIEDGNRSTAGKLEAELKARGLEVPARNGGDRPEPAAELPSPALRLGHLPPSEPLRLADSGLPENAAAELMSGKISGWLYSRPTATSPSPWESVPETQPGHSAVRRILREVCEGWRALGGGSFSSITWIKVGDSGFRTKTLLSAATGGWLDLQSWRPGLEWMPVSGAFIQMALSMPISEGHSEFGKILSSSANHAALLSLPRALSDVSMMDETSASASLEKSFRESAASFRAILSEFFSAEISQMSAAYAPAMSGPGGDFAFWMNAEKMAPAVSAVQKAASLAEKLSGMNLSGKVREQGTPSGSSRLWRMGEGEEWVPGELVFGEDTAAKTLFVSTSPAAAALVASAPAEVPGLLMKGVVDFSLASSQLAKNLPPGSESALSELRQVMDWLGKVGISVRPEGGSAISMDIEGGSPSSP